jgi:uncharacterized alkaline shock family protein YloU
MKFISRIAVLFYVTVVLFLSISVLAFVFRVIPLKSVIDGLTFIYYDEKIALIVIASTFVAIFVNFMFFNVFSDRQQRGKIIAFDNPSGRVSVSLSAMEDLVKRVIAAVQEVKEVRSSITVGKKGLNVEARIILNTDVNIPEMTSRLQELVKRKMQNTIGLEEDIVVRVHVFRIIPSRKTKQSKSKDDDAAVSDKAVPFQGYRA